MVPAELSCAVSQAGPGAPHRRAGTGRFLDEALRVASHPVTRIVARRIALAVPLLFVVSALSFVLLSLAPGDAANQILGPHATPQQYAALRHQLGLNLPVYEQYWRWLRNALTGNLGTSLTTGQTVIQAIWQHLPVTLSLFVGSLLVTIVVGVGLGVLSAIRGGVLGRFADVLSLIGFALPAFWVGAELIALFAVKLTWFPASGYISPAQSVLAWLRSLVLPVLALSLYGIAVTARQAREAMLGALASEHVRMAWANGLPARSIFFRHALRNASIPVVTVLGLVAVALVGGTVFVENVFSLPGLGSLVVNAAGQGDLPTVQGVAVFFTLVVVLVNLVIDLFYIWLNPRVRLG
jgi:peptide/nickel transport system permease protein